MTKPLFATQNGRTVILNWREFPHLVAIVARINPGLIAREGLQP